jgi:hypothetical protein
MICSNSQSKSLRKRKKVSFELKVPKAFLIDSLLNYSVVYRTLVSGCLVGKYERQVGKNATQVGKYRVQVGKIVI